MVSWSYWSTSWLACSFASASSFASAVLSELISSAFCTYSLISSIVSALLISVSYVAFSSVVNVVNPAIWFSPSSFSWANSSMLSTSSDRWACSTASVSVAFAGPDNKVNDSITVLAACFSASNDCSAVTLSSTNAFASATSPSTSSIVVAWPISSLKTSFSSSVNSSNWLISSNAFSFCFSNNNCFSPGVSSRIRSFLLIVSWDGSDSVWSGNVIVAVPSSEISTLVPERKLLLSSIAFLMIFFSSKLRLAPKSCTLIFSVGIDISVLPGTVNNFWCLITILKKSACKFCLILFW